MTKTHVLFILFYLCNISIVSAHLGNLVGKVLDAQTHQAIVGATITLQSHNKGTSTDVNGIFRLKYLSSDTYTISVSSIGYKKFETTVSVLADQTTTVEWFLTPSEVLLSEVKVTANNPQQQQVISTLDIKTRPINNSQEILRIIPGLVMGQHAGGGKAEQIFLRGFDIDHGTDIKLTVDDMPINMVSHAHGQGYADAHFIIPEIIEAVDFQKGLYDASKGNFATAGWANFKTKTSLENSFAKASIGQFNTYRLASGVNLLHTAEQSAFVAGEYLYSDAYFDAPQHFKRWNLFGKYHAHLTPNSHLTLTASSFRSNWDASGQIPERAVANGSIGFFGAIDPNEGGTTSRNNLNITLLSQTPTGNVWKNQAFYSHYTFDLYSNFTFFLEDPINGDQIKQAEKRHLWGYNSDYTVNHLVGNKEAHLTAGLNYRHDITTDTELSHTKNRNELLQRIKWGNINEANVGIFVEENIQLSQKLSANIGLRWDVFYNQYLDKLQNNTVSHAQASIVSPKLHLYFTPNQQIQFYLKTGKGFHSNDTRAVIAQQGLAILPAAYGSDLGLIWKPIPKLLLNTAFWYLWLDQEFVYVGDAGVVEPSGQSRRLGIDLSARYQLYNAWYLDLDANWAQPRAVGEATGQAYLPLAVTFSSIGGITLKKQQGWGGSLRYRYIGNRPATEDYSLTAQGYFVCDALINYQKKPFAIELSIQNIFNTKWKETQFATTSQLANESSPVEEIHFTPGTPFNAKLSVTWHF